MKRNPQRHAFGHNFGNLEELPYHKIILFTKDNRQIELLWDVDWERWVVRSLDGPIVVLPQISNVIHLESEK